jgi:hypothetical protein
VVSNNCSSPAAQHLPTPTPQEEQPYIRHPAKIGEDVGIIPNVDLPTAATMAAVGIAGFGFQASSTAVTTFTTANFFSGLAGPSTAAHPSFTLGTMAARRGAPPFFRDLAGPLYAPSMTKEAAPKLPRLFGRVAAEPCRDWGLLL